MGDKVALRHSIQLEELERKVKIMQQALETLSKWINTQTEINEDTENRLEELEGKRT